MRNILFLLVAVLLTVSCQQQAQNTNTAFDAKRYPLTGKVVSVNRAAKKATIDHKEVPGYMDAMTMDFPIKEDWVWDELTPGSEINAELVVTKDSFWLEKIAIIAAPKPGQAPPANNDNVAQVGSEVPDFSLVNQDKKRISMKDFRGKALAITFIYRECPLPNYCIKMSQNFSDAAKEIQNDPDAKTRMRLLSISFDPARDTPDNLRQYGIGYMGNSANPDFTVWQLAVGSDKEVKAIADFFGLQYETDENNRSQINHSLRTAVISPTGKVTKIFSGNEWTPAELLSELKASLNEPAGK